MLAYSIPPPKATTQDTHQSILLNQPYTQAISILSITNTLQESISKQITANSLWQNVTENSWGLIFKCDHHSGIIFRSHFNVWNYPEPFWLKNFLKNKKIKNQTKNPQIFGTMVLNTHLWDNSILSPRIWIGTQNTEEESFHPWPQSGRTHLLMNNTP